MDGMYGIRGKTCGISSPTKAIRGKTCGKLAPIAPTRGVVNYDWYLHKYRENCRHIYSDFA